MEENEALYKRREEEYEKAMLKQVINQQFLQRQKQIERQLPAQPDQPIRYTNSFNYKQEPLSSRLVPIRIDIDMEGIRIRDVFTWNLDDKSINLEDYAKLLLKDTGHPIDQYQLVAKVIKEQIDDFFQHSPDLFYKDLELPERRIVITLDIAIGQQSIVDKVLFANQFEWDIGCTRNSPEQFAEQMVSDLNLHPEFITAISHSIREQIYVIAKGLLIVNHDFYAETIQDPLFLPNLSSGHRLAKDIQEFTPSLTFTTKEEMDKIERALERENRRKRRQTQRSKRLVALPEGDNSKTHRTPLPVAVKFEPTVKVKVFHCTHCNAVILKKTNYCDSCETHLFQFDELPELA